MKSVFFCLETSQKLTETLQEVFSKLEGTSRNCSELQWVLELTKQRRNNAIRVKMLETSKTN